MTRIIHRARPRLARPPELRSATSGVDSDALARILGLVDANTTTVPVTELTVRGLAGVDAAVRKIGNAVGQMMCAAEAFGPDGSTPLAAQPVVLTDPDALLDSFVFWRSLVEHGLMRGNWVGIKSDYDPATVYPRQVQGVPIDAVHADYDDETGLPCYDIAGVRYGVDDVVHIRFGYLRPGQVMAIGAVEAHRRELQAQLDLSVMTSGVWRHGAVPSGVVQLDTANPTTGQADLVKANWVSVLGGRRTVAVTGKAMTYTPITWSAEDAQFLESRQFSIAEAAIIFGLKPEDLGASFGAASGTESYGNRTDDAVQRITDAYMPVTLPIEQAWSRLIPGRNFVRGSAEALLRSTTRERYELRQLAQAIGLETVDESRAAEGKGPAPKPDPTPPAPPAPTTDPNPTPEAQP